MAKNKSNIRNRILKWVKIVVLVFFGSTVFFAILYRFVNPPLTPLMVIRCTEQLFDGKPLTLKKDWVPIEEISKQLPLAVVSSEDNEFLNHYGIDFEAIEKAKELNKKSKKLRGASTISQQTAKNVFLWPARSWVRKGFEVYFTALIEVFWGKRRIMEVYLNVIEMGNGIYGAEMASQTYFRKPAAKLSRQEAALLATILPNPRKWNPAKPTSYMLRKQKWIIRNMNNVDPVDFGK